MYAIKKSTIIAQLTSFGEPLLSPPEAAMDTLKSFLSVRVLQRLQASQSDGEKYG